MLQISVAALRKKNEERKKKSTRRPATWMGREALEKKMKLRGLEKVCLSSHQHNRSVMSF